ncbi:MAG: type II toxin-antitoxin system HicB family antitoxin [Spirochaetaceae bacterium]|jgi:antitoxin HicB|nr:type II toxin-antitoxin system HicB family antitoxin [Spirochaetaceae bacterium]
MKTHIPCLITYSEEDKCWYVKSPGFYSGILTDGDSLEEAKVNAAEAVNGLLSVYLENSDDFSIPSDNAGKDWFNIEVNPNLAFSLWLKEMRIEKKMTLADVANKLGIRYQVYQKLENPKTSNPTLKTMAKLEKVFDTELLAI